MFFGMMDAPIKFQCFFCSFPENDRRDQFMTYYFDVGSADGYWIFSLDPHVSDECYQGELDRLVKDHECDMTKYNFNRVQFPKDYVIGTYKDKGEHFVNPQPGQWTFQMNQWYDY